MSRLKPIRYLNFAVVGKTFHSFFWNTHTANGTSSHKLNEFLVLCGGKSPETAPSLTWHGKNICKTVLFPSGSLQFFTGFAEETRKLNFLLIKFFKLGISNFSCTQKLCSCFQT